MFVLSVVLIGSFFLECFDVVGGEAEFVDLLGDSGVESLEAIFKVVGEFFELAGGESDLFSGNADGFSGGLAFDYVLARSSDHGLK